MQAVTIAFECIKGVSVVISTYEGMTKTHDGVQKAIHDRNTFWCEGIQKIRGEDFLKKSILEVSHEQLLKMHTDYQNDKFFLTRWFNHIYSTSSPETDTLVKLAKERTLNEEEYQYDRKFLASKVVDFMLKCKDKGFCLYLFMHISDLVRKDSPYTITQVRAEETVGNENTNANAVGPSR